MRGVIPNEDAFRRIGDATKFFEQTYRNRGLKDDRRPIFESRDTTFEGYLCGDLDAAESTLSAPATATAVRLVKNASSGNLEHGSDYTITNRDTTLTLESGTYIVWKRINGEYRIIWAACRAEVSSSCSGVS